MTNSQTGLEIGAIFAESFLVEKKIGTGSLGEVFRVRHEDTSYALKLLHTKVVPGYISIAKIASVIKTHQFNHPGIVSPIDVGEADGRKYLLLPYIDGHNMRSLLDYMQDEELVGDDRMTAIVLDRVAAALQDLPPFAVHGALKASNILIQGMGEEGPFLESAQAYITDFGLSKILSFSKYASLQLSAGPPYYYLAPEFISMGGRVDQKADQYSMGVLAYEILTGAVPRKNYRPVADQNPYASEEWDDFLNRLLAKQPSDRFADIADLREAIRDLYGDIPEMDAYPEMVAPSFAVEVIEEEAGVEPETRDEFDDLLDGAIASSEQLDISDEPVPEVFEKAIEAAEVVDPALPPDVSVEETGQPDEVAFQAAETTEDRVPEAEEDWIPDLDKLEADATAEPEPAEEIPEAAVEEETAEESAEEEAVEEEAAEEEVVEEEPVEEEAVEEEAEAVEEEVVEEEPAEEEAVEEEAEAVEAEEIEEEAVEEEPVEEEDVEEEAAEEEAVEEEPVEKEVAEEEAVEEEPVEEEAVEEEAVEEEPAEEESEVVEEEVAEEEAVEEEPVEEEVAEEEAVEEEPVEEEAVEEEAVEEEPVEEEVAEEEPVEEEVEAVKAEAADEEAIEEPGESEQLEFAELAAEEDEAEEAEPEEAPDEAAEQVEEPTPEEDAEIPAETVEEIKAEAEVPAIPRPAPAKKSPVWFIIGGVVLLAIIFVIAGMQQGWFGKEVQPVAPTPVALVAPTPAPEPTPEETPVVENNLEKISALVEKAKQHMKAKAYVRPKKACVLAVLGEIEQLDDGHTYPGQARTEMLNDLRIQVKAALADKRWKEALQGSQDALLISPGNKEFYKYYAQAKKERDLALLLEKLKAYMAQERYVMPPNACAFSVIKRIEAVQPNHPEAIKARTIIFQQILMQAQNELQNELWDRAINTAQNGLKVKPNSPDFQQIIAKAKQMKEQTPVPTPEPSPSPTPAVAKRCPDGMRFVSGGSVRLGSAPSDPMRKPGEKPNTPVYVSGFCIDLYEYPNQPGTVPRVNVSWYTARKLCTQNGKRLCSEREWERTCKGPANRRFPYGNDFNPNRCATQDADGQDRGVASSGGWAGCRSSFGVYDLSGNVREWTSSPVAPGQSAYVVRGGSANQPDWAVRCAVREASIPSTRSHTLGFRCCRDPIPQ